MPFNGASTVYRFHFSFRRKRPTQFLEKAAFTLYNPKNQCMTISPRIQKHLRSNFKLPFWNRLRCTYHFEKGFWRKVYFALSHQLFRRDCFYISYIHKNKYMKMNLMKISLRLQNTTHMNFKLQEWLIFSRLFVWIWTLCFHNLLGWMDESSPSYYLPDKMVLVWWGGPFQIYHCSHFMSWLKSSTFYLFLPQTMISSKKVTKSIAYQKS